MSGFILWCCCSAIFVGIGISDWRAEMPVHFWTVKEDFEVTDVKKYNRTIAVMWYVFAAYMVVIGLPLLAGQNSAWSIIPILGGMAGAIGMMVTYVFVERKYRVKK